MKYYKETKKKTEEEQYISDLDKHYLYDNSIRSESVVSIQKRFVVDHESGVLWAAIYTLLNHMWHAKRDKVGEMQPERLRLFMDNDPALLKSHNAKLVEVFFRTSDTPYQEQAVPFSPWPDLYLGEFYLHFKDGKPYRMVQTLHGIDANHPLARRERVTDYTKFPGCWMEGKEESRNHLWFPGTNVPVEEMTEQLYHELKQTLPAEMLF